MIIREISGQKQTAQMKTILKITSIVLLLCSAKMAHIIFFTQILAPYPESYLNLGIILMALMLVGSAFTFYCSKIKTFIEKTLLRTELGITVGELNDMLKDIPEEKPGSKCDALIFVQLEGDNYLMDAISIDIEKGDMIIRAQHPTIKAQN